MRQHRYGTWLTHHIVTVGSTKWETWEASSAGFMLWHTFCVKASNPTKTKWLQSIRLLVPEFFMSPLCSSHSLWFSCHLWGVFGFHPHSPTWSYLLLNSPTHYLRAVRLKSFILAGERFLIIKCAGTVRQWSLWSSIPSSFFQEVEAARHSMLRKIYYLTDEVL